MRKLEIFDQNIKNIIGKRSSFDIYNHDGILLVPASAIITYEHALLLQENGISININDVEKEESQVPDKIQRIDEAVDEIKYIFAYIRQKSQIPLAKIRQEIVPKIHVTSSDYEVLQLFTALQAKDDYTFRHHIAVGAISHLIGTWMQLPGRELRQLTTAALLHDIGKIFIPKEILHKPGRLTEEEFKKMKKHTLYGYEILKRTIGIHPRQALVALQHHERMDGSGYPFQLKHREIDLFSRIVAVADVFHAMSSNRVYQDRSPLYAVLEEMEREMFLKLDPEITYLFIKNTMNSLIGRRVLLTDGQKGKIVLVPENDPIRPLIKVENQFIDLRFKQNLQIDQILP